MVSEAGPAFALAGASTRSDIVRCYYFLLWRRTFYFLFAIPPMLCAAAVLLYLMLSTEFYDPPRGHIAFLCCLICACVAWPFLPYWLARYYVWRDRETMGPRKVAFFEDGLRSSGAGIALDLAWSRILEIRETRSLYVLMLKQNQGVLVPKHFFPSAGEEARWRAFVASRIAPKKMVPPRGVAKYC